MMSSEEETDCFGLYGDKLSKKAKRARQRVDAGEPRNSYSSIPNFTSRPSFMSGGIYGAIFEQNRQHFGLFGPGYGPAKMLNELLGRQAKQAADAEAAQADDCDRPAGDLAHRMLRGILQSRKKDRASPDNNNSIRNNNNDELKDGDDCEVKPLNGGGVEVDGSGDEASAAAAAMQDCLAEAGIGGKQQQAELLEEAMLGMNGGGDSRSLPSPVSVDALVTPKIEPDQDDAAKDAACAASKTDRVPMDMKRARVENIVSTMRSSPVLPTQPQVNGCKKRKRYQPQQHDNSAAERYSATLGLNINLQNLMMEEEDDDEVDRPPIQQKLVRNALKTQLLSMKEQLVDLRQKYMHLCTRIELESETHENEEVSSDMEQDASNHADKSSPVASPDKEIPAQILQANTAPNMLSQMRSKMMSAKVHPHMGQPHGLPHGYNGAIPLMQHIVQAGHEGGHPHPMHHPNQTHHHHATSNAAAMYLGVSHVQKLLMEQEARMVKEAAHAAEQHQHNQAAQQQQQQQQHQHQQQMSPHPGVKVPSELADRMIMLRNSSNSGLGAVNGADLDGLAEVLKSEITASLTNLIDSIVTRFVHQRRFMGKQSEAAAAAAEQLNKDLMLASQLLERKSPRLKPGERPTSGQSTGNLPNHQNLPNANIPNTLMNHPHSMNMQMNGAAFPAMSIAMHMNASSEQGSANSHQRPPATAAMFQAPKQTQGLSPAAAALYGSMGAFCAPEREQNPEQNEALSLVVTAKKKRHKVTDTRITPRTVSRILAQDGLGPSPCAPESKPFGESPSPRPYHPPHALPVSLPTSVAIPNPSLHESQVFSPYSPFFAPHHRGHPGSLGHGTPAGKMLGAHSPGGLEARDSPPLPHPPALLHPALLAAAHHGSPDYSHLRPHLDSNDPNSDCNSTDIAYDVHSSTLTPMHLRKAKLMFFWVRYPSSAVLKMYFPDIKFNKNNTAQLVKWFSNFREFYYIQMEKYARQAVSEGVKSADELHVAGDSEIYRVLNLHYNRNNHIEVPSNFRYVVEQTLREFYRAIQGGKDTEQSWKKSIYKIISRLDDPVPEYFKSPNFLEQLE